MQVDSEHDKPLFAACLSGNLLKVKELLDGGSHIMATNCVSLMHILCKMSEDMLCISHCSRHCVSIKMPQSSNDWLQFASHQIGKTCLHVACEEGHMEVLWKRRRGIDYMDNWTGERHVVAADIWSLLHSTIIDDISPEIIDDISPAGRIK